MLVVEVVVSASLPGIAPDDVQITMTGQNLSLRGEFKSDEKVERDQYLYRERRYGTFHRQLQLPVRVQGDAGGAVVEEMIGLPYDVTRERAVAAAAKARADMIVFTTPNNPTGKVFTREELELIAGLCIEYDVLAFTDPFPLNPGEQDGARGQNRELPSLHTGRG